MPTAAHLHTLSVQLSFQQYSHKWLYTDIQPTYNLAKLSLSVYTHRNLMVRLASQLLLKDHEDRKYAGEVVGVISCKYSIQF